MAIQTLNTIKQWFKTGLKPTQIQFWDTWDSFRHKNEKLYTNEVEGLNESLNSKTDKSDFKTINGESIVGSGNIIIEKNVPGIQSVRGNNVDNTDPQNPVIREYSVIKGEYINNTEALSGGLLEGDLYNLPTDKNNAIVCVVKAPQSRLSLTFANIETTCSNAGILDKNNIKDWNTYFTSVNSMPFNSVLIEGNKASFIGNSFATPVISLNGMGIIFANFIEGFNGTILLNLQENQLTEFYFDSSIVLKGLMALLLGFNNIETYDPPTPLPTTLNSLVIRNNLLTNWNTTIPLHEGFTDLTLEYNRISNYNPDKSPISLIYLNIANNLLDGSFDPSVDMSHTMFLNLSNNNLTEFNPTQPYSSLKELNLSHNLLSTFKPEYALSNLQLLNLNYNNLTHFYTLNNNNVLTQLYLGFNHITTIDFTVPESLEAFAIDYNGLTDFDIDLSGNIKTISLNGNPINVFEPTYSLSNLQYLYLNYTGISKFNPVSPLTSLVGLDLANNLITTKEWNSSAWTDNLPSTGFLFISSGGNSDSITGTAAETALLSKNWNIIK